jgi:hypothetical protein
MTTQTKHIEQSKIKGHAKRLTKQRMTCKWEFTNLITFISKNDQIENQIGVDGENDIYM